MTPAQGQVPNGGADPRLDALRACRQALRREAHTLTERPDLLWQQLYNRLQWEEDPVPGLLHPQLHRRSAPGATPWLKTRSRLRESEALRLTLNTGGSRACAISPNSDFVVTASYDGTCGIWDAATGKERATLRGHTDKVLACTISPDSDFVVTRSEDKTCKIWDAATGSERATLTGHINKVLACAISPDSGFVVTASGDSTCKIWDAATGRERLTLPLLGPSDCVALHAWLPFAVCGDAGGGVYLIDLVGIEYGPIAVTAVDLGRGGGPSIRCPKCLQLHPLNEAWLGQVIECPTPNCGLSLRVNPFITRKPDRGRWWSRK